MLSRSSILPKVSRFSSSATVRLFSSSSASFNASASEPSTQEEFNSLKIKNPRMRNAILNGYANFSGPPSLKSRTSRVRYQTPKGLDEVFPLALDIVNAHKAKLYKKVDELKEELKTISATENPEAYEQVSKEIEKTLVKAEIDNPEVQYNFTIKQIDWDQPVYRHLAKKQWEDYNLLILMQRLESLKAIPDTEPTLDPKVEVTLKFLGPVNKDVTPGSIVPCKVASYPPILNIQEFDSNSTTEQSLYTVLIVNPDTPNLETDSYSTTLQWAVSNIPITMKNSFVDVEKSTELLSYLPPVPEKNAGNQRFVVWVYKQNGTIDSNSDSVSSLISRENFDIRKFSSSLDLTAVGAHLWRCHFDRTTDGVREKYGLPEGRVFTRTRR